MVNISKPELVREVLAKPKEFRKSKLNPIADKLFPGLVKYEDDKWAMHRKIINPAFHVEKLKLMLPAFLSSCTKMMKKWEKMVGETGSSKEVDVWPYFKSLSGDVISKAAFGSSYEEGHKIFELVAEQTGLALQLLKLAQIPGLRFIPTAKNRRFKEVNDEIHSLLEGIVNKRKKAIEGGEAPKDDLLGILMDCNSKEIQEAGASIESKKKNQHFGMSLEEVIDECKLFYIAGQETTSILLTWTLILLSKHQDWQARARQEVLQIFGNKLPLDFDRLNHLKIVTMILYEVLRLYPPVTQLSRKIYKDTKLGELSLPAGVVMSLPILFIHHDKELWGSDAEEFRPGRFSEGLLKATRGNNSFFAFSGGPRICIGEKFSLTEARMALSMILQRFSFELSPSYVHAPMTVFLLQPQHGAQIILHRL